MSHEKDDFELKREMDALPRSIEPPEDLWPGVRSRLGRRRVRVWWRSAPVLRLAALLTLLAGASVALGVSRYRAATWAVLAAGHSRTLHQGETFTTGAETARLRVGAIGTVDVDSATRVRLLVSRALEHRLALDRGTIHAQVNAPPHLFTVETPSGTAVDLGCAYTLEVDSTGTSTIRVTLGWVSFADHGLESLIPAGMRALTRKGGAIGTPVREDATDSLRQAIEAYDVDPDDSTLTVILRQARRLDAVTLWHLVSRTSDAQRDEVVSRLIELVPPPQGVTPEAVLRADGPAMQLYWEQLPGTLPITPEWKKKLWLWWLKVAG